MKKQLAVYSLSMLIYSAARQAIFFPMIYRINEELFNKVFLIFLLFDFLIYFIGAVFGDFYVKRNRGKINNIRQLRTLLVVSMMTAIVFVTPIIQYNFSNIYLSIVSSLYLLVYANVVIIQKAYFNDGWFSINIYSVSMKVLGLLASLISIFIIAPTNALMILQIVVSILLFFELLSLRYLFYKSKYLILGKVSFKYIKKSTPMLILFFISYFLFSVINRGEPIIFAQVWHSEHNLLLFISVLFLFLMPANLIFSSAFMSFIARSGFIDKAVQNHGLIITLVAIYSLISSLIIDTATDLLYGSVVDIEKIWVFFIIFFSLLVIWIKPFVVLKVNVDKIVSSLALYVLLMLIIVMTSPLEWYEAITLIFAIKYLFLVWIYKHE